MKTILHSTQLSASSICTCTYVCSYASLVKSRLLDNVILLRSHYYTSWRILASTTGRRSVSHSSVELQHRTQLLLSLKFKRPMIMRMKSFCKMRDAVKVCFHWPSASACASISFQHTKCVTSLQRPHLAALAHAFLATSFGPITLILLVVVMTKRCGNPMAAVHLRTAHRDPP